MALIRVIINTEKISFNKLFTDHDQAIKETDQFLFDHELNDGCSLGSEEDFLALNALLAEMFDDPCNCDNYAQWDDIEAELLQHLQQHIYHQDSMQPGTVSRATLLSQDITQACIEALYSVDPDKVLELIQKEPKMAAALYDHVILQGQNDWWDSYEATCFVNEDLFDLMDHYSPEGHYFGANEGDGSDFGYWPDDDHLSDYE